MLKLAARINAVLSLFLLLFFFGAPLAVSAFATISTPRPDELSLCGLGRKTECPAGQMVPRAIK
jgi:hypothetical protein